MHLKEFLFIQVVLFLLISFVNGFSQQPKGKSAVDSTSSKPNVNEQSRNRLTSQNLLSKEKGLSPAEFEKNNDDSGLMEVNEDDIPEGSLVYVLEEPENQPVDGEIMNTANNIVFRPLFRYRSKQEAQRRNSNRIRRRYFIPRRSYRQTYRYPYYYNRIYY